jgi:acetolactate synthase-1/2/3 large subunit
MLTRSTRHLKNLQGVRRFPTTSQGTAASPYRAAVQSASNKPVSETSKRAQSTVATAVNERPTPSPAFNRDDTRLDRLQPLDRKEEGLDHSFVGMNGGQIFHEMMLRQGVKEICRWHCSQEPA